MSSSASNGLKMVKCNVLIDRPHRPAEPVYKTRGEKNSKTEKSEVSRYIRTGIIEIIVITAIIATDGLCRRL